MATVFVTFFVITQFHVYEMDAHYTKRRRESEKSLREKRWSMNSQRLEEIVAELMKPISDVRRSFDTDLSALLEEYLTEAGLRALEEGEEGEEGEHPGGAADAVPNFAELALLLQQSACIYSRKVDFLYQHVLDVSDSLHASTQEASALAEEPQTPSSRRKRRRSTVGAGGASEFCAIELTAAGSARRDAPARPPPTLPRGYLELEPRVLTDADAPLLDYSGDPIGLITDFQVTWRLQDGLLVDELQVAESEESAGAEGGGRLHAVPLAELQAAIEAAAPPDLPPPPLDSQLQLQPEPEPDPLACSTPNAIVKRERKRRSDVRLEEIAGAGKMLISAEVRRRLAQPEEFALPRRWIARVVAARKERVLSARRRLRALHQTEFHGFDETDSTDIGGFAGWSVSEAECAAGALARRPRADSDDDGFFDQSSTGDSDDSAAALATPTAADTSLEGSPEWAAWRDSVVARAAAAAARGSGDVRAAGAAVLRAVAALPACASCDALLAATAHHPADVSRMFLATLFLANTGHVEIVPGAPLALNSFSVRLPAADRRDPPRPTCS